MSNHLQGRIGELVIHLKRDIYALSKLRRIAIWVLIMNWAVV